MSVLWIASAALVAAAWIATAYLWHLDQRRADQRSRERHRAYKVWREGWRP